MEGAPWIGCPGAQQSGGSMPLARELERRGLESEDRIGSFRLLFMVSFLRLLAVIVLVLARFYYIFIVPFITGVARSGEKDGTSPHIIPLQAIPVFIAKYAQFTKH